MVFWHSAERRMARFWHQHVPAQITPIAPAVGIAHYNTNTALIGVVRCETANYKMVYFGFGPEQMSNAAVGRSMVALSHDWFYGVVSVEEMDALLSTTLGQAYPVPANDQITIPFSDLRTSATLEVYDVTGRSVMQKNITSGATQVVLDVAGLRSGLYRYALRTAEGIGAAKAFQVVNDLCYTLWEEPPFMNGGSFRSTNSLTPVPFKVYLRLP